MKSSRLVLKRFVGSFHGILEVSHGNSLYIFLVVICSFMFAPVVAHWKFLTLPSLHTGRLTHGRCTSPDSFRTKTCARGAVASGWPPFYGNVTRGNNSSPTSSQVLSRNGETLGTRLIQVLPGKKWEIIKSRGHVISCGDQNREGGVGWVWATMNYWVGCCAGTMFITFIIVS